MKKSRFTEEQIVGILRETDRDAVATVAKRHGVSEQAIYTWRKRFGSFQPDDVRRLKQLEQENARLKKLASSPSMNSSITTELPAAPKRLPASVITSYSIHYTKLYDSPQRRGASPVP